MMQYDFMGNALTSPSMLDMLLSAPSLMTIGFIVLCVGVGFALYRRA
jgi:hypothetical protein